MKTMLTTQVAILFSVILMIPVGSRAQESEIHKDFQFSKSNDSESIPFIVNDKTKKLEIRFEGGLVEGAMRIRISDPDGNVVSGFSLVCSGYKKGSVGRSTGSSATSGRTGRSERTTGRSSSRSASRSVRTADRSTATATSEASEKAKVTATKSTSGNKSVSSNSEKSEKMTSNSYAKTESDESGARGVMVKEIENPMAGEWKYTVITEDASGKLTGKIILH